MEQTLSVLADIATIVTGAAVLFAIVPFHQARKQSCRDANQWFVDRYWELQDQKRVRREWNGALSTVTPLKIRVAELRLCEDELDARAQGWVANDNWRVWSASILAHGSDQEMVSTLKALPHDELILLRSFLEHGDDPQQIGTFRQWWRGIR